MKISNSLETCYQDNYVPIICVSEKYSIFAIKETNQDREQRFFFFLISPNYTETYTGVLNYFQ